MLSACGGSNVSDQYNADSVAVTTPSEKDAQTEKAGIEYVNNRFHFSVTIPNDFVAQPDPENGDGARILGRSGLVSGQKTGPDRLHGNMHKNYEIVSALSKLRKSRHFLYNEIDYNFITAFQGKCGRV